MFPFRSGCVVSIILMRIKKTNLTNLTLVRSRLSVPQFMNGDRTYERVSLHSSVCFNMKAVTVYVWQIIIFLLFYKEAILQPFLEQLSSIKCIIALVSFRCHLCSHKITSYSKWIFALDYMLLCKKTSTLFVLNSRPCLLSSPSTRFAP